MTIAHVPPVALLTLAMSRPPIVHSPRGRHRAAFITPKEATLEVLRGAEDSSLGTFRAARLRRVTVAASIHSPLKYRSHWRNGKALTCQGLNGVPTGVCTRYFHIRLADRGPPGGLA